MNLTRRCYSILISIYTLLSAYQTYRASREHNRSLIKEQGTLTRRLAILLLSSCCCFGLAVAYSGMQGTLHQAELEKLVSSRPSKIPTVITFSNDTSKIRKIYWLDYNGQRVLYRELQPGQLHRQETFLTHAWLVTDAQDNGLAVYFADSESRVIHLLDDQSVVEWITAHAVRLTTPEPRHGFADMEPLKKMIGDARIVSLGEATHGTREFFQLKHRMLEFLTTEMGFTIFSIEANMPEAYRLNDYVLNGNGDPAKLLKGMYFWTWDTQEVLDMILWMREFNKSGKGRVQFTGFDMQTPNVAMDIARDFVTRYDTDYAADLRRASDMANAAWRAGGGGANFGVATTTFPIQAAAGKRVHYSGYIKTEGVSKGWAGLWWRVDGSSGVLAFDNMQDRGATGTTDWKRYEIDLLVPATAKNINFGALHTGEGTAWFDGLKVELDGSNYSDMSAFDLDFESNTTKGFYTGGDGYNVSLDSQVFHNGKQSLRMTRVASTNEAVDPKGASSSWKEVVRHLQASREVYSKKGAVAQDIEWAIQNARVVLQSMQMRTNEVSRDRSMADNVKWILDNNPGAKIVLWAHNGHVATVSGGEVGSMGASLRQMFGNKMVVFGFAFNQGSFQAIEQGKGLRDFTVPPAPLGSLDATLAAAGIPLFALDLRNIPKSGPRLG